jgi:hypothetical protein
VAAFRFSKARHCVGGFVVKRRIAWGLLIAIAGAALWVLNIEVTYERNVRHIPASFRLERYADITLSKA